MAAWRRQLLVRVSAGGLALLGLPTAAAVPAVWKGCEQEVARYCPKAADEDAVFACLAKRISLGAKAKLSDACYAAYERFELRKCGVSGCREHLWADPSGRRAP